MLGAAYGVAATGLIEEVIYLVVTFRRAGLHARDLAQCLWRPGLATAIMAWTLLGTGLAQPPSDAGLLWNCLALAMTVAFGTLVFGAALLLAWLASGRPRGGETYLLSMAGETIRHLFRK